MLRKLNWIATSQVGLDARKLLAFAFQVPRYLRSLARFRRSYVGKLELTPCLHDWNQEGGATRSEYFWQDLLVARKIFAARPEKHVDVGSRVDGFVAHVASFRDLEVLDIRPVSARIPGVVFRQADLMSTSEALDNYCDSLSCLHALEHFGLGRYGDDIDPKGSERGFLNMVRWIRPGGHFYLSVPVGNERVEFNANRVFDPGTIMSLAERCRLSLLSLTVIHQDGRNEVLLPTEANLRDLAKQRYSLGLFTFLKPANE